VSFTLTIGEKRTDFLDGLLVNVSSPVVTVSVVATVSSVTDGKEHFTEDDNFNVAFACCSSGNLSIALGLGGDIESSVGSIGSVVGIGVLSEWLDAESKSRGEVEAMVLGDDRIIDMVVMMVD